MGKFQRTQLLSLSLIIAIIFFIIPLLSSSSSSSSTNYLIYLIINVLIITLGAEAGLLSTSSTSSNNTKSPNHHYQQQQHPTNKVDEKPMNDDNDHVFEKIDIEHKMCPSNAPRSIFFIGSEDNQQVKEVEVKVEAEEVDQGKEVSQENNEEEELFVKAEVFIGNFYKQLKMQREESWNRIHGFNSNVGYT